MDYDQYNREILGDGREYNKNGAAALRESDDYLMDELIAECMADMEFDNPITA